MSGAEPEEIRFACIGCGALNPVGAESCTGCGHRFAGTDVVSTPAPARPVVPPERRPFSPEPYYEPPKAPIVAPRTFRIGTMMALIAVIALCLAAFAAGTGQGIIALFALGPATIRTLFVSAGREAEGRPMTLGEQVGTFCFTILSLFAIVISAGIGFFATCFPVGMISNGNPVSLFIGVIGAIVAAVWVGVGFLRIAREHAESDRARDQIRWQ